MAAPKTARLIAAESVGPNARWLRFALGETGPLGFVGGQYIIVDSGLVHASGKLAKRAYSVLSTDEEQTHFELAMRRIGPGAVSNYLHQLALGAVLTFSGPWGKLVPDAAPDGGTTLVLATDTGITAALGLVQASAFRERLARTTLLWLVESKYDFVPESFVRGKVPDDCAEVAVAALPPVGHPERVATGLAHLERWCSPRPPARAYLAGDGALLYPFTAALSAAGLAESRISIESFFNAPARKVDVSTAGETRA